MTVEIKKDLLNTYMVIGGEGEEIRDTYEIRILMSNRIEGLIPMEIESFNGAAVCRYDITDMKPLTRCLGGDAGDGVSVRTIYLNLLDTLSVLDDYLLDPGHLMLDPEYIFMCGKSGKLAAAYVPFYMKDVRQSLISLTETLLTRIGHEDPETVVLTCRILYELQKDGSPIEPLRLLLAGDGAVRGIESRSAGGMYEGAEPLPYAGGRDAQAGRYPLHENVPQSGDSRPEPEAYVLHEITGDGMTQRTAGRSAEAIGVIPFAQDSISGDLPGGGTGSMGEKRGRKPGEKKERREKREKKERKEGRERERKPKDRRERPQREKPPRKEQRPKAPRKTAERKGSESAAAREKKSGLAAVRMALIAAIPAALIFAILHIQDYLVLSTVEAAGISFFAAADIMLILYLAGYLKQRRAEKRAAAEAEEERAETYPYGGDGGQFVPLYAQTAVGQAPGAPYLQGTAETERAGSDSIGTLIPDDRTLPPIRLGGREILVGKQKSLVDVVI
ncbi:MAG: DUF6382 domain-containing protein, partial [Lachnospiraceae bacterium]|nr:DUF6382 domain-containing protein [Lachnospiraceae bacterium]